MFFTDEKYSSIAVEQIFSLPDEAHLVGLVKRCTPDALDIGIACVVTGLNGSSGYQRVHLHENMSLPSVLDYSHIIQLSPSTNDTGVVNYIIIDINWRG